MSRARLRLTSIVTKAEELQKHTSNAAVLKRLSRPSEKNSASDNQKSFVPYSQLQHRRWHASQFPSEQFGFIGSELDLFKFLESKQAGRCCAHRLYDTALRTGFRRVPIPSISTSTTSPGFILRVLPGVPV